MFSPQGPSLRELAVQALSSVEGGYDLLAPKFDRTPFRTPDGVLDATAGALRPLGPFGPGLDVCCGTGAGMRVLESLCRGPITGVDFSTGMLAQARGAYPDAGWVRADVRALPFAGAFDLAVSFGAFGHLLPAERPALFAGVYRALRPGGLFAFPLGAPLPVTSGWYWALAGFDLAMRVRNAVWRPPFVMYYRTWPLPAVRSDLTAAGFTVTTVPMTAPGRPEDGSPRNRLVLARRPKKVAAAYLGADVAGPRLRRGTGADADSAAELYLRARRHAVPEIPPLAHPDDEVWHWMHRVLAEQEAWLAVDGDGTLLGLMVLDGDWVEQLYLDPAWTGRGLGSRFVELARQRRPGGLQLWTFVSNVRAQRFYERHGFTVEERTDGSGNEEKAPDLRYVWRPPAPKASLSLTLHSLNLTLHSENLILHSDRLAEVS